MSRHRGATDADELAAWLRLEQTAGVGAETARRLLAAFGLPANIFSTSFSALHKIVPERIAYALLAAPSDATLALIERTLEWLQQPANQLFTLADAGYPQALLDIADPPLMLYVKGRAELLARPALAVVGSRNATVQGIANADRFAEILSQRGLTIISGLALGVDAAAHQGALRGAAGNAEAGSTIAVIGTGADIVYPARNRGLAHQIAEAGCIVSEYPLGMPGIAANFPRRNRIVSGLARGVLVVEAAAQSGSLITARMAGEQGRDVFAIPGSIHSPLSKGCHQLIKQGAKLVESAQDILEELRSFHSPVKVPASVAAGEALVAIEDTVVSTDDELLRQLGYDPVSFDVLAARCDSDAASLNGRLLELELAGLIEVLPGGLYRRLD
ncbi:DNA processing protein [Collimonas sp. PA-H2]|uniref:DNA-processing protein DprA n=1 Tax=Collimonas sp. PA-H2 TaxID=1881062 RepID=UPI000BF38EBF|nr:DNA-processing protein DprA [Collimonas sp. PA-H2]PFH09357.1 DNA processing protein [Collimonas sp. PA-H2]